MFILLSPSKTQDFSPLKKFYPTNPPHFTDEINQLVKKYRQLSPAELSQKMAISEKLAILNFQRYQDFQEKFTEKNAKPAIFTFKGDVYSDIHPETYNQEQLEYLQKHVRTISGLYGILKPFDLIQPYRLEMKYETAFWKEKLPYYLNQELQKEEQPIIINLASKEYSSAAITPELKAKIITPVFKEKKNNQYKIIALYAKKARGTMTDYLIKNKVNNIEKIKNFNLDGYRFNPELSTPKSPTFTRN